MIVVTISGKPVDRNPPKPKTRVIWNEDEAPDNKAIPTEKPVQEPRGGDSPLSRGVVSPQAIPGGSHSAPDPLPSAHDSLWQEITAIKSERETLSSSIAPLVARFQREGKIVGTRIQDPEAKAQLSKLYDQIDALTKEASTVYRQIDSGGVVPPSKGGDSDSSESGGSDPARIAELKLLKRSLQNRRHKLRKKIESAEAMQKVKTAGGLSSPGGEVSASRRTEGGSVAKLQQWQLQLAALDTEEQSVNEKLQAL